MRRFFGEPFPKWTDKTQKHHVFFCESDWNEQSLLSCHVMLYFHPCSNNVSEKQDLKFKRHVAAF